MTPFLPLIAAVCALFLAIPAFAADGRDVIVSRQLDCMDQKLKNGNSIDWNDICSTGYAVPVAAVRYEVPDRPLVVTTSLGVNYRKDDLKWNVAAPGGDPNILSELTWKDVHSAEVETHGNAVLEKHFILADWRVGYGWIYSGKNQDSDYNSNGKTDEFSRSNNNTSQGHVYDFSGGGGLRADLLPLVPTQAQQDIGMQELSMDVLGGYSFSRQKYYMTEGVQTIPASGPFAGLKSTYQAEWKGPWVGTQISGAGNRWHGLTRFEYHWADYEGVGDWNLRADLAHPKSFSQTANGNGYLIQAVGGYDVLPWWSVDLSARWQRWEVNDGTSTAYLSGGGSSDEPFNEAIWTSLSVGLASTMRF